jgi:hypothetical protein
MSDTRVSLLLSRNFSPMVPRMKLIASILALALVFPLPSQAAYLFGQPEVLDHERTILLPAKIIVKKADDYEPQSGSYTCVDQSGKKYRAELKYRNEERVDLNFQGNSIRFRSRGTGDDQVYASAKKDKKGRSYEFDIGNSGLSIRIYGPGKKLAQHECDLSS